MSSTTYENEENIPLIILIKTEFGMNYTRKE